jgi:hypothetical protein
MGEQALGGSTLRLSEGNVLTIPQEFLLHERHFPAREFRGILRIFTSAWGNPQLLYIWLHIDVTTLSREPPH